MIAMRSHSASAASSVCVLIRIVWPRRTYSLNRSRRILIDLGSSPTCGSSTTITCGRCTNADRDDQLLPHAVRVALDQLVAPLLEVEERHQLARAVLDLGTLLAVQPRDEAQELRAGELLVDERPVGNEAELRLRRDRVPAMSIPPISTVPAVGFRMPAIMRSVVVFPAPFGPTKPNSSPDGTCRSIESTAVKFPYFLVSRDSRITSPPAL